jgi:hypothetical protein
VGARPDRDARNTPTRRQLGDGDVTHSRKLEGAWWAGAGAYVVASTFAITGPWRDHRS